MVWAAVSSHKKSATDERLVAILGRVVFRRDDQTPAFTCAQVDGLDDVDHFLLVLQCPVDFVVITGAQIDHDVLISEEKHHRAGVVKLVHLVEIRHFCYVDQIDDCEIVYLFAGALGQKIAISKPGTPTVSCRKTFYAAESGPWILHSPCPQSNTEPRPSSCRSDPNRGQIESQPLDLLRTGWPDRLASRCADAIACKTF